MRLVFATIALASLVSSSAGAEAFDPLEFESGGAFPAGAVTINSTDLTVGGFLWTGAAVPAAGSSLAAVFTFDGDAILDAPITLLGSRAVVLLFQGPAAISTSILVASGRGTGGGAGAGDSDRGTGGGGFGGRGGNGANATGGAANGDLFSELRGGSNGGPAGASFAMSGGGLEIGAIGLLDLSGASILADGASGVTTNEGDGLGGASGGGIFLHAFSILLDEATTLSARGGNGGNANDNDPFTTGLGGGGGGGGRIAVLPNDAGGYDVGGATIRLLGGSGGLTEDGVTGPGGSGVFEARSSPTVGVPESGELASGLGALAVLAARARHASRGVSSRRPCCTI